MRGVWVFQRLGPRGPFSGFGAVSPGQLEWVLRKAVPLAGGRGFVVVRAVCIPGDGKPPPAFRMRGAGLWSLGGGGLVGGMESEWELRRWWSI